MSGVSVVIKGDDAIRAVALVRSGLLNLRPVYEAMGQAFERQVQLRFDTKTSPTGKPWKAWAEGTAEQRSEEGRGTLLEYTGRMRDSLTSQASDDGVRVGFGVAYAKFHELGTRFMPARPLLLEGGKTLSADDEQVLVAAAVRAIRNQLKAIK